MTTTPKTLPLLNPAIEVSAGDLFATRQGSDTKDRKQTAGALLTYVRENFGPFPPTGRLVTLPGDVVVGANDGIIEIDKTIPEETIVEILDGLPAWRVYTIKDGGFNASSYPIILTPSSGTIEGYSTFVMDTDGQSIDFYSNGTDIRIV